jgi:serine carboxypeptidase-like clade II
MIGGSKKKWSTFNNYTPWTRNYKKQNGLGEVPPCVDGTSVVTYLNREDVKTALYIPENAPTYDMCQDGIDYTVLPIGSQWIWEGLKGEYRMLKYSGDTDGAVPLIGTRNWINSMNRTVLEEWRPFYL